MPILQDLNAFFIDNDSFLGLGMFFFHNYKINKLMLHFSFEKIGFLSVV